MPGSAPHCSVKMWGAVLTILALASAVSGCGTGAEQPSVGLADATVFPWTGLVYYVEANGTEVPFAMCTLVDRQYVMLTGYVTATSKPGEMFVQFGVVDIQNTASAFNYTVDKIIYHPKRNMGHVSPTQDDIALLRLNQPVQYNEKVSPVCLPVKGQKYDAEEFYFVSYNIGRKPAHPEAKGKKYISLLKRNSTVDCAEILKYNMPRVPNPTNVTYICAGDTESDACEGDLSSPLLTKTPHGWTAVGVFHFGENGWYCQTGVPSAFISVVEYVEWIQGALAN